MGHRLFKMCAKNDTSSAVLLDINHTIPSKSCKVLSRLFPQIFILI
jgi:hypothetical protein